MNWKPIEAIPATLKDGREILLYGEDERGRPFAQYCKWDGFVWIGRDEIFPRYYCDLAAPGEYRHNVNQDLGVGGFFS